MTTKEIKIYNIGFIGCFDSSRRNVRAYTAKEAKEYFCTIFGGSLGYVVAKHHDVVSLNDHRHSIDWWDAENGKIMSKMENGRSSLVIAGEL